MITNRISAALSTTDQETVMQAIATIREKLPFLIDLTRNERVSLTKLGDKSQGFVKRAFELATQSTDLIPQTLIDEMRKDTELLDRFASIRLAIDLLQKQIDDTVTQVGAEAYAAARTVYAVTKTPFAHATLRTASTDLGKTFRKRSTATAADPQGSSEPPSPAHPNA